MNFQDSADWTYPVPIHYGPGRISELPEISEHPEFSEFLGFFARFEKDFICKN